MNWLTLTSAQMNLPPREKLRLFSEAAQDNSGWLALVKPVDPESVVFAVSISPPWNMKFSRLSVEQFTCSCNEFLKKFDALELEAIVAAHLAFSGRRDLYWANSNDVGLVSNKARLVEAKLLFQELPHATLEEMETEDFD